MTVMPAVGRMLAARDLPALQRLFDTDPVSHCFVASRVREMPSSFTDIWGWFPAGRLTAGIHNGANLVPLATTQQARAEYVARVGALGRRCSSLVGPAAEVLDLWRQLEPYWGPAREVRADQPLMATSRSALVRAHPGLRMLEPVELDLLDPAYVAMFTEEVGVPPSAGGVGTAYRGRLAQLLRQGRSLAILRRGKIVFKAELGAVTPVVTQVHGVWVAPEARGQGLGIAGMAAVVNYARAHFAPVVSLYVNSYNTTALHVYERVGFAPVGTFATVLF